MAPIETLEDFQAWQAARRLAVAVYRLPKNHPAMTDYGFRDQLCRAVVSQMSNIAEAHGRIGGGEKKRFLSFARGSGYEAQSMFYLGGDIDYFSRDERAQFIEMTRAPIGQVTQLVKYLMTSPTR